MYLANKFQNIEARPTQLLELAEIEMNELAPVAEAMGAAGVAARRR